MDSNSAGQIGVHRAIIFRTLERCWSWCANDPPCCDVPQSSLPSDTYSPAIDTGANDELNPYIKYCQQCLIRAWRQAVSVQCEKHSTNHSCRPRETLFGSDQYICSHILSETKSYIARRHGGMLVWSQVKVRATDISRESEFNIGLGYGSEIWLTAVFAEDGTKWIQLSGKEQLHKSQNDHGISRKNGRPEAVAADVTSSAPPLSALLDSTTGETR